MIQNFRPQSKAGGIIIACFLMLCLFPAWLGAQAYPQVYFLTDYSSSSSALHDIFYSWVKYDSDLSDWLNIYSTYHAFRSYSDIGGGCSDYTENFDGNVQLFPDYFIYRSPGKAYTYRTSKISNDGYYLVDDYSNCLDPDSIDVHIKYYYTADMKLQRISRQERSPFKQWTTECVLDSLGRRLEDVTSYSTDMVNWTIYCYSQYTYSGEQLSGDQEFEKFSAYIPEYYTGPEHGLDIQHPYLNDEWAMQSATTFHQNPPYGPLGIVTEIDYNQGGEIIGSMDFDTWVKWYSNGLPKTIEDAYYGVTLEFNYRHTSSTPVDDDVILSPPLLRVWPNPTRDQANLDLALSKSFPVTVKTYNLRGQLMKQESYMHSSADNSTFCWKAVDSQGRQLQSGVYFIRMKWDGGERTAKIAVVK